MSKNAIQFLRQLIKLRTEAPSFENVLKGGFLKYIRKAKGGSGIFTLELKVTVTGGGEGKCTCELTVKEEHQNTGGSLHGGLTATLVDAVSTWALLTTERQVAGVSVDLSVSFMKPAKVGENIVITAETLKMGKTLAFINVNITSKESGRLIAQGKHTKFVG